MAEQTANTPNERPWDWTPPPMVNRVMKTILRTPLLHRMMSKQLMLLTFTGRKSGKTYTTPVGYFRTGETITVLTKRFRKWWHNFEQPAPVTMRIRGKLVTGRAESLTDPETIIPIMDHLMREHPREAAIFGVETVDGQPDPDSLREIAPKVVVIRIVVDK